MKKNEFCERYMRLHQPYTYCSHKMPPQYMLRSSASTKNTASFDKGLNKKRSRRHYIQYSKEQR